MGASSSGSWFDGSRVDLRYAILVNGVWDLQTVDAKNSTGLFPSLKFDATDRPSIAYYKKTKKRIFLMAPIHHHFEKLGWPESRIVVRFWIVSFACAILGLITTLKVR